MHASTTLFHAHQGYWQRIPQEMAGVNITANMPPHLYLHRIRDGAHGPKSPRGPIHPTQSSHYNNQTNTSARHLWWPRGRCPSGIPQLMHTFCFHGHLQDLWQTLHPSDRPLPHHIQPWPRICCCLLHLRCQCNLLCSHQELLKRRTSLCILQDLRLAYSPQLQTSPT